MTTTFDLDRLGYSVGSWSCQPGQPSSEELSTSDGTSQLVLETTFDAISGGDSALLGAMTLVWNGGRDDCVRMGAYGADGTVIVDAFGDTRQLDANSLGMVCVNDAGFDACEPRVAVEPTTWGQIKARFR